MRMNRRPVERVNCHIPNAAAADRAPGLEGRLHMRQGRHALGNAVFLQGLENVLPPEPRAYQALLETLRHSLLHPQASRRGAKGWRGTDWAPRRPEPLFLIAQFTGPAIGQAGQHVAIVANGLADCRFARARRKILKRNLSVHHANVEAVMHQAAVPPGFAEDALPEVNLGP